MRLHRGDLFVLGVDHGLLFLHGLDQDRHEAAVIHTEALAVFDGDDFGHELVDLFGDETEVFAGAVGLEVVVVLQGLHRHDLVEAVADRLKVALVALRAHGHEAGRMDGQCACSAATDDLVGIAVKARGVVDVVAAEEDRALVPAHVGADHLVRTGLGGAAADEHVVEGLHDLDRALHGQALVGRVGAHAGIARDDRAADRRRRTAVADRQATVGAEQARARPDVPVVVGADPGRIAHVEAAGPSLPVQALVARNPEPAAIGIDVADGVELINRCRCADADILGRYFLRRKHHEQDKQDVNKAEPVIHNHVD